MLDRRDIGTGSTAGSTALLGYEIDKPAGVQMQPAPLARLILHLHFERLVPRVQLGNGGLVLRAGRDTVRGLETDDEDHYATLGLDRRCTAAQIRSAYRLLSKRFHPDLHPDSAEALARSQALNAAHEVLSDPARRRAYDRDLGGREESMAPRRAGKLERNIAQDVHLRIEAFLRGATLRVTVRDPANPNGEEVFELVVPSETAPGVRLRLPREAPFAGGFVMVRLRVLPGFRFKARGSDLKCDLRINAQRAAKGGSEMISGPAGGPLRVEIPAGVSRGEVLRIRGEGLPKPRGGRGDLLVRVTYRPEVRVSRTG